MVLCRRFDMGRPTACEFLRPVSRPLEAFIGGLPFTDLPSYVCVKLGS